MLITLVIIGVIAALAIPNLMQSWTKQALKSELKKAYSEINNVSQKFTSDKGMTFYESCKENIYSQTGTPYTDKLPEQLTKYMKITAYSPKDITKTNAGYLVRDNAKTLNNNEIYYRFFDDGYFKDNRGREWFFEYSVPALSVDLNGLNKGPNSWGYDIFTFIINQNNQQVTPDKASGQCNKLQSGAYNGIGCAYYALYDISPTDKSQTYWEDFLK